MQLSARKTLAELGVTTVPSVHQPIGLPADCGPAVIAISRNMDEVTHVTDRVAVLYGAGWRWHTQPATSTRRHSSS